MSRRRVWVTAFLAVTAAALGAELVAAFDGDPDTPPWTELIVRYVPWPITALAVTVLVTWLPTHFSDAYRQFWRGRPAGAKQIDPLTEGGEPMSDLAKSLLRELVQKIGGVVFVWLAAHGLDLPKDVQDAAFLAAVGGGLVAWTAIVRFLETRKSPAARGLGRVLMLGIGSKPTYPTPPPAA